MKLFLYYALHTVKNQLKKLFKTWVLIFLVACIAIGALIGVGIASLEDMAEEPAQEDTVDGAPADDAPVDDGDLIEIGVDTEHLLGVVELIAGAVILAVMVWSILGADKNGSKIFLPADVNLLFAAPLRPQTVLLFRLTTQLGMILLASVYILFQLPNLMMNLGLSIWEGLALIGTWLLTVAVSKLLQVLLYTVCSTHAELKQYLRRAVYAVLLLAVVAYAVFWRQSGLGYLEAAVALYASRTSRWIPVWGWLKGIALYAIEGSYGGVLLCLAGVGAVMITLLLTIRRVKADFYEDAMAKSEETAELLERAQSAEKGGITFVRRKKERGDSLRRDGMRYGSGANVFFFKPLYNRFRFAHLGIFTKTAETYLVLGLGVALLCRFVFNTVSVIPVALTLAGLAFYRSLGNPLEEDTKMDCFRLVPESMWAKLLYSLLGGTANCLLDLLPAMVVAVLVLRADVLTALAWIPFILSVDFYATSVGTFIALSAPVAAGKVLKQVVQVLFLYFGLLPDAGILAVGLIGGHSAAAALGAAAVNVVLGLLFFALSPLFLTPGK